MGAQMVKEVASKTNDNAGDGTTTATILAQAIVTEGLKYVTAGMNPMDVKVGDIVLFGKWSGTEVKIDSQEYSIMKESDIMGISKSKK